ADAVALRLRALAEGGIREGRAVGLRLARNRDRVRRPSRRPRSTGKRIGHPHRRRTCHPRGRRAPACDSRTRCRRAAPPEGAGLRPMSEAEPRISVIIPTFNRAHLLPAALESVAAQRECPPFEIVVVDDASTDGTPALLSTRGDGLRVVRMARNGGV